MYKEKHSRLRDNGQVVSSLLRNSFLIKTSASVRAGVEFSFIDQRRILLLDGVDFRINLINEIIKVTPSGSRKLILIYWKGVIYNHFSRALEELDECISCKPSDGLFLGGPDKGLWVVYSCFRVVYEIGNNYLFKNFDNFSDDEYRATMITYSYIWQYSYQSFFKQAYDMKCAKKY